MPSVQDILQGFVTVPSSFGNTTPTSGFAGPVVRPQTASPDWDAIGLQNSAEEAARARENTIPPIVTTDYPPEWFAQFADPDGTAAPATADDFRVRLKPFTAAKTRVLGEPGPNNILTPLHSTNGLLFPYTPTIQFSQEVDYKTIDLVHTNYETFAYSRTPSVTLAISGKFTVQTENEGRYALAALHFLRVVSKMYFGKAHAENPELAGMPPPVLLLNGYGTYMYNDLRVIVRNHSYTMDDTVHLVQFSTSDGERVRLPAVFMLSLSLTVVQTPKAQKDRFNLDEFRTGALMKQKGWI